MKSKRLLDNLGAISDRFIEEAAPAERKPARRTWVKWAAMAACLCLIAAAALITPRLAKPPVQTPGDSPAGGTVVSYDGRRYVAIFSSEGLSEELPAAITDDIIGQRLTFLEPGDEVDYEQTATPTDKALYECLLDLQEDILIVRDGDGSWFVLRTR